MKSVMYSLIKGFLYGNVLGLLFGMAIFLLASAVDTISALPVSPVQLLAIIYGASVTIGVAKEYDMWLESEE